MHALRIVLAAASLSTACAHAQLLDQAPVPFDVPPSRATLALPWTPPETGYFRDESERSQLPWDGWRSSPRFVVGSHLTRHLALEAGYRERFDHVYRKIDQGDPADRIGALGVNGFHTDAAAKVTLPLTARLSTYGLLGLAYSERRGPDSVRRHDQDVDLGTFTKLGADYKPNANTTISGAYQNFGATAAKWGRLGTDANGLLGNMKIKF